MKTLMIAAMALTLASSGAIAQRRGPPPPPASDRDDRNDRDDRDDDRYGRGDRDEPGSRSRRDYRDDGPPPRHWGNRGRSSWSQHVRACQARYRSYNPRTDRYIARPGQSRRCML